MPTSARSGSLPASLCVLSLAFLAACSSVGSGSPASPSGGTTSEASAAASSTPSGPETAVAAALAGLDRRAQVSQLFVVGVPLADLPSGDALAGSGVGGIFLAGRSTAAASDLAVTTARWQSLAPGPPLWVAADQEGGAVQTLTGPGFDRVPPAPELGRLPGDQLTTVAEGMGASLHGAGLNLDFAPVVDMVPPGTESSNEPIGRSGRQYGGTGAAVTAAAGRVVDGLAASDVTATLKHFPGLGRVRGNTDTSTNVTDDVTAAGDEQLTAFADVLAQSPAPPFVMVSLATYTRIDPTNQAVFSPAVLTDLLRGRLGFDGVVVSDDLANARAVSDVPPGDRAVRFLAAGGTLVLTVQPSLLGEMVDAVLARSDADPDFSVVVDAAVHTALLAKARAGLLPAG